MNPMHECRGLSLSLRADLTASRPTTGRDNRLHDSSPCDVSRGIAISVIAMSTVDTQEGGLALAILFGTMTTLATGPRCVGRVDRVQWHTCKSSFVRQEEPELPEGPIGMAMTLRLA